jgi:hypothetical protein
MGWSWTVEWAGVWSPSLHRVARLGEGLGTGVPSILGLYIAKVSVIGSN